MLWRRSRRRSRRLRRGTWWTSSGAASAASAGSDLWGGPAGTRASRADRGVRSTICRLIVGTQKAADCAQWTAFIAAGSESRRKFAAHLLQRHALQHDVAGTGERREEQSLTAEECGLDTTGELDIVIY